MELKKFPSRFSGMKVRNISTLLWGKRVIIVIFVLSLSGSFSGMMGYKDSKWCFKLASVVIQRVCGAYKTDK